MPRFHESLSRGATLLDRPNECYISRPPFLPPPTGIDEVDGCELNGDDYEYEMRVEEELWEPFHDTYLGSEAEYYSDVNKYSDAEDDMKEYYSRLTNNSDAEEDEEVGAELN